MSANRLIQTKTPRGVCFYPTPKEDETMPQLSLQPSATSQPPRPYDPIEEPVACRPSRIPHHSPQRPLHPPQQPSEQRPLQPPQQHSPPQRPRQIPQQHSPQRPLQIPHRSLQRPLQPPRMPSAEQPLQQPSAEFGAMLCGEGAAATSVSVAMAVGDSGRHSEATMRQHPAPEAPANGEHHVQKSDDDDRDDGSRLSFL